MRRLSLALAACLAIAVCAKASPAAAAGPCPINLSQIGCNTPHAFALPQAAATPAGPEFPDVSVWQGAVNWGSVAGWQRSHGWRAAAIFKLGEYTLDSQAVRNSSETARLGFWRAGYWFVRNTGCAHEAGLIVWAAQRFGLKVVVLDSEVPEARGYDACLAPIVKRAGLAVVEYTSPGSNPDSSNPGLSVWTAAFGPARTPCVWTCSVGQLDRQSILAWQFTDGRYGPVVSIPGIGSDDVSVDYGITRLPVAPKPKPAKASGVANAEISENVATGKWTIRPLAGKVTFAPETRWSSLEVQRQRGTWRLRGLPFDAKPLGAR